MKCPHCGEDLTVTGSPLGTVADGALDPPTVKARIMVDVTHVAPGCQQFIDNPLSVLGG